MCNHVVAATGTRCARQSALGSLFCWQHRQLYGEPPAGGFAGGIVGTITNTAQATITAGNYEPLNYEPLRPPRDWLGYAEELVAARPPAVQKPAMTPEFFTLEFLAAVLKAADIPLSYKRQLVVEFSEAFHEADTGFNAMAFMALMDWSTK